MIDDNQLRTFVFFSANLQKLLPNIPYAHHVDLFGEAQRFAQLTADDDMHRGWLEKDIPTLGQPIDLSTPGIIATYHMGPYRLLPMWLAQQGIPITLLVSADVGKNQRDTYHAWYQSLGLQSGGFAMLEAEDPMVIRKMIHALRQGHFLMVYVDGNMGSRSARGRSELVVDFLAHKIRVRTGVADVARLAGTPIYPVIARVEEAMRLRLAIYPPIGPIGQKIDKGTWTVETMQIIYRRIAEAIQKDPMQWEGWFYVHGDMVYEETARVNELFRFYLPFRLREHYFLLHKDSYKAYRLPEQLYQKLCKIVLK